MSNQVKTVPRGRTSCFGRTGVYIRQLGNEVTKTSSLWPTCALAELADATNWAGRACPTWSAPGRAGGLDWVDMSRFHVRWAGARFPTRGNRSPMTSCTRVRRSAVTVS